MEQKIEQQQESTRVQQLVNYRLEQALQHLISARANLTGLNSFKIDMVKGEIDAVMHDIIDYQLHPE